MRPAASRVSSSSAGTSTSTTSSARSKNVSGTVSRTRTPVMPPTTSLRLSRCWTFSVVKTSMPAASSSSTSCQRFGWREPCALLCASSSTRTSCGRRASAASRSNSSSGPGIARAMRARQHLERRVVAGPPSRAAVSARPCVSTSRRRRRAPRPRGARASAASRTSCRRRPMRRSRCAAGRGRGPRRPASREPATRRDRGAWTSPHARPTRSRRRETASSDNGPSDNADMPLGWEPTRRRYGRGQPRRRPIHHEERSCIVR